MTEAGDLTEIRPATADRGAPRPAMRLVELLLALVVGIAAAAFAALLVMRTPNVYLSRATVIIDQPRAIAESRDDGVILKLSRLRIKYAGLVSTSRIAEPVAQKLNLPEPLVRRAAHASSEKLSLIMAIDARAGDPTVANSIAQAVAEEVITYTDQEQDSLKLPETQRFEFSLVDRASPGVKISPTRDRLLASALVSGLLGFAGGLFGLRFLLEGRRRA